MLEFEYAKALAEIVWKENDTLAEERIQTLQSIFRRAWYYQERGMLEEIILGFVQKKIKMIQQAETKGNCRRSADRQSPFTTATVLFLENTIPRKRKCWSGALHL